MNELRIAFIQADILWEKPDRNRERFQMLAGEIHSPIDVLLLPEMFNTGFCPDPDRFAEPEDGPTVHMMAGLARKKNCLVMATVAVKENGKFYNRLFCLFPDGSKITVDKHHLFRLSGEKDTFTPGNERKIVSWKGWKILPLVCYDLRFPVWSMNTFHEGAYEYDLLVYLSNWPKSRERVWKSLLIARAIENQSFVIGVNRIGKDGHGTDHAGESMVINPKGVVMCNAPVPGEAFTGSCILSGEELSSFRNDFPIGPDWDHFTIQKI